MLPNHYLSEKYMGVHHHELLREAEQRHLLAHLPRRHPHLRWNVATRFRAFLASLRPSIVKTVQPARTATGQL
jgi:hypothetical protein